MWTNISRCIYNTIQYNTYYTYYTCIQPIYNQAMRYTHFYRSVFCRLSHPHDPRAHRCPQPHKIPQLVGPLLEPLDICICIPKLAATGILLTGKPPRRSCSLQHPVSASSSPTLYLFSHTLRQIIKHTSMATIVYRIPASLISPFHISNHLLC